MSTTALNQPLFILPLGVSSSANQHITALEPAEPIISDGLIVSWQEVSNDSDSLVLQTVSVNSARISVPQTADGMHKLIHLLESRTERYASERATATKRICELLQFIHLVHSEMERADRDLRAAHRDLKIVETLAESCGLSDACKVARCDHCNTQATA
uniref:Uncharacterized protein n=1 Tax=Mycena chlorophos TaxID=658473 RepID=A0ABQ0M6A0_MYCCL|nr:predicted protein [Mycena chlorophos]